MARVSQDISGVPGHMIGNARTGWRWVATHYGWEKIKALVKAAANSRCEQCHAFEQWGDTHHIYGRGGGKRDDRPVLPDGRKNLEYLCRECHGTTEIKRYAPVSAAQPAGATSSQSET